MHPVPGERVAGGGRLRELVLVVREAQVEAAAVDVELRAEIAPRHRGALDVPARRPAPHGESQVADAGSSGFAPFHRAKSRGSRLPRGSASCGRLHGVERLAGELAVRRPGAHVEVHVPCGGPRPCRGVGVPGVDQTRDELLHLRDRRGRPRLVRRADGCRSPHTPARTRAPCGTRAPTTAPPTVALASTLSSMSVTLRTNVTRPWRCSSQRRRMSKLSAPRRCPMCGPGLHRRAADVDRDVLGVEGHEVAQAPAPWCRRAGESPHQPTGGASAEPGRDEHGRTEGCCMSSPSSPPRCSSARRARRRRSVPTAPLRCRSA